MFQVKIQRLGRPYHSNGCDDDGEYEKRFTQYKYTQEVRDVQEFELGEAVGGAVRRFRTDPDVRRAPLSEVDFRVVVGRCPFVSRAPCG